MRGRIAVMLAALASAAALPRAIGQDRGAGAAEGTAKASAPVDLVGYWVALVTEDWRFRMVTPRKGDYRAVPLTEVAKKIADRWDPAADEESGNQCKSYGAAAIMRAAARFHITWQDDNTLRVDSDYGMQTRLFHFKAASSPEERTWQGDSAAEWQRPASLKVATTHLRSGYLRKNGVPYSARTTLTEYYDHFTEPNGDEWFTITTIVTDPEYLAVPFVTTTDFRKEPDGSRWSPSPCTAR